MNTWNDAFGQKGLAAATAAPMSVEEQDLPPGAAPYSGGPLANQLPQPTPAPTPNPNVSLTTLAAGGMNHAQLWMSGQSSAPIQQQQPFNRSQTQPVAPERNEKLPDINHFSWASAFQ